jgi:hypothetical protein
MSSPDKIISYEVVPSSSIKYFSKGYKHQLITKRHLIALDDEDRLWQFNYFDDQGWHCLN